MDGDGAHAIEARGLVTRYGGVLALDGVDPPVPTGNALGPAERFAALVHHPPVLFLDEPTTGPDPQSRNDLWDVVRGLVADGTTVLLTTQYPEEADPPADTNAVIDRGTVLVEGTSAELKRRLGATAVELTMAGDGAGAAAAPDAREEALR